MFRPNYRWYWTSLFILMAAALVSAAAAQPSRTWTVNADFQLGTMDGVNCTDVPDQLQLSKVPTTFPNAWVANSGEGTVSKIDTVTGVEVARYRTGPNGAADSPSRTAVDVDGNCWVANRAFGIQGTVTKIMNSGGVNTSSGPGDVKAWGTDDRVALHVNVGGWNSVPRAIAIDASGRVWVGLYNESRYVVLDPTTGATLFAVATALPPYGAAIDGAGRLWNAGLMWGLEQIDLNLLGGPASVGSWWQGGGYGIAVDAAGIVWLGAYGLSGVFRFDPSTSTGVQHPDGLGTFAGRGVSVMPNGNVWVAEGYGWPNNTVTKYDAAGNCLATYTITDGTNTGVNPCGVGTDSDGNVIVVCQDSWDVWKLKEADGSVIWRCPVGVTPYTYSDFTGYVVRNITQKTGTWTVVHDGGTAGMAWGTCSWTELSPPEGSVGVRVRTGDTAAQLAAAPWLAVLNGVLFGPINGQYIEIEARLTTTSEVSPALFDLAIEPYDVTPPVVRCNVATPELWPPNHQMVNVGLSAIITDNMDPSPVVLVEVYADEDDETPTGDGVFSPDALDIGLGTLRLRSERKGDADGRVYLVVVKAIDDMGNMGFCCRTVVVPHSMSKKAVESLHPHAMHGTIA